MADFISNKEIRAIVKNNNRIIKGIQKQYKQYEKDKSYFAEMKEENLTFVNLLASPQGIKNIRDRFKKIRIVKAHIDEKLNEKGYIVPGLGDAGDRLFNTFN